MRVYKKENDIIIQNERSLYCLWSKWDEYINDDQLYKKQKPPLKMQKP